MSTSTIYNLPGPCSISTSMEDAGALGWTEGMSHTQAAQQYMHIEESTHDFIECTQSSHIEEG